MLDIAIVFSEDELKKFECHNVDSSPHGAFWILGKAQNLPAYAEYCWHCGDRLEEQHEA